MKRRLPLQRRSTSTRKNDHCNNNNKRERFLHSHDVPLTDLTRNTIADIFACSICRKSEADSPTRYRRTCCGALTCSTCFTLPAAQLNCPICSASPHGEPAEMCSLASRILTLIYQGDQKCADGIKRRAVDTVLLGGNKNSRREVNARPIKDVSHSSDVGSQSECATILRANNHANLGMRRRIRSIRLSKSDLTDASCDKKRSQLDGPSPTLSPLTSATKENGICSNNETAELTCTSTERTQSVFEFYQTNKDPPFTKPKDFKSKSLLHKDRNPLAISSSNKKSPVQIPSTSSVSNEGVPFPFKYVTESLRTRRRYNFVRAPRLRPPTSAQSRKPELAMTESSRNLPELRRPVVLEDRACSPILDEGQWGVERLKSSLTEGNPAVVIAHTDRAVQTVAMPSTTPQDFIRTSTPIRSNSIVLSPYKTSSGLIACDLEHIIFESPQKGTSRTIITDSDTDTLTPVRMGGKAGPTRMLSAMTDRSLGNESSSDLFGILGVNEADDVIGTVVETDQWSARNDEFAGFDTATHYIVGTNLTDTELSDMSAFAKTFSFSIKSNVDSSCTHVVTKSTVHRAYSRTLKSIQAIARKLFLLDYTWVEDSVRTGRLMPEQNYEMVVELSSGDKSSAPFRSRTTQSSLFSNHEAIFIGPSIEGASVSKADFEELAQLSGMRVLTSLTAFSSDMDVVKLVLVTSENDLPSSECDALYRDRNIRCILSSWLIDSLTSFDLQPFSAFALYNQGL